MGLYLGSSKIASLHLGQAEQISYEEGKRAEYDRFWDAYQQNGDRTQYIFAFAGECWTEETFLPKYPMMATASSGWIFAYNRIKKLKTHMENHGIVLDTSRAVNLEHFFRGAKVEEYGILNCTGVSNLNYVLYAANGLKSIEKIILKNDGSQTGLFFAQNATELEEISFEGVIGQNGWSFEWNNKLSHDSLMSIINALKDFTGTGTTRVLTLGATNLAKLTDAEKAIATQKGWTLA